MNFEISVFFPPFFSILLMHLCVWYVEWHHALPRCHSNSSRASKCRQITRHRNTRSAPPCRRRSRKPEMTQTVTTVTWPILGTVPPRVRNDTVPTVRDTAASNSRSRYRRKTGLVIFFCTSLTRISLSRTVHYRICILISSKSYVRVRSSQFFLQY